MLIFLYGPDTFRSRQKLNQLKTKFIKEVDKSGLNIEMLDGQNLETNDFQKAISTPPFLAKKRMVIIENLIAKNKGQKIQKEILETINQVSLEDVIIIFWEGELENKKIKKPKLGQKRTNLLLHRLQTEKFAQEFGLLSEAEVYRFAAEEIKNRGGKIEPNALRLLTELVGNDLWQLNTELDKLLATAKEKPITSSDVKNLVSSKLEEDIFKLTDAIGQKNKKLALKLISDQLKSGTSPNELLAKIIWQFKNLLLVYDFTKNYGASYSANRLTYQLGLHPFVVKKTMAQVKNYDLESLKETYRQLLKIDYKLKTSPTSPEALFDLLIVKS